MNLLEPKRHNPTVFRLGMNQSYVIIGEEFDPEPIPLDEKIEIKGNCYGMNIYTDNGGRLYYATQSEIVSAEIKKDYLIVYEDGKSIPWKITKNGEVIRQSRFDDKKDDDINYIVQKYGLTKEAIPRLNDYEACIENVIHVEPKVSSPILIDLRDPKYSQDCYLDENGNTKIPLEYLSATILVDKNAPKLPLSNGVMLDSTRPKYGFKVINSRKSNTFPTQCPLDGVQVVNGLIEVYEQGKTIPWRIDVNGDVQEYAQFVEISRRDVRYVNEKLCLSRADIANVNSYGLKYVNKEN